MMMNLLRTTRPATFLPVLLVALALPLAGQSTGARPLRVAIPDQFPIANARALVLRYSAGTPDVVVLNPANATPDALAAAMGVLHRLRRAEPTPTKDRMAVITGFAEEPGHNRSRLVLLATKLQELAAQPKSRIGNLGPGRWLELDDPRLRP